MRRQDVPPRLIEIAASFPDWCLELDILRTLRKRRITPHRMLREVLGTSCIIKMNGGKVRVRAILRSIQTKADWEDNVLRILLLPEVHFPRSGSLPRFPRPPFPDTPHLTALSTARALKSDSFLMENCAFSNHADEVRGGHAFFYKWAVDGERVTVALARDQKGCWGIFDLRTFGNSPPSPATHLKIIAALAEALGDRFNHPLHEKASE